MSAMNGMIDIHTHILPGVDDGAQTLPQALALIRRAYEDGVRALILTPHYRGRFRENTADRLRETLESLRPAAEESGVPMELYLGSEVHYQSGVMDLVSEGRVLSMAGSDYVLLEFRPDAAPSQVRIGVNEAESRGYTPIIAHAERYDCFRRQPSLAYEMRELGALIQLNAASVTGENGFFVKRYCAGLLKEELVHFIASDAHNIQRRPPILSACFRKVCRQYGNEYAVRIFRDNPRKVIENSMI